LALRLVQDRLNVADKSRSNVFSWRGQFTPQFVEYLLDELATETDVIADPFCGSGTVLLEAATKGHVAFGLELNPAAYAMAKFACLSSLSLKERMDLVRTVESHIRKCCRDFGDLPLWTESSNYREKTRHLLSIGRSLFDLCNTKQETLLATLTLFEADGIRNGELVPAVDASFARIHARLNRLPYLDHAPSVHLCDARLAETSIKVECDLIITSPPYINVFNYHQNHRAIVELLGFDILRVARSEIGSNRKNRQNRFRTVVQYAVEMERCLTSWSQILSPCGRVVLILGRESNVRGVPFRNGDMVAEIATEGGVFTLDSVHERAFTNRFGNTIYEDILVLEKNKQASSTTNTGRHVASRHLHAALAIEANDGVHQGIRDAIEELHNIPESPLLERMPIL
jgi:16S rRNA G966 N2-methylase RsmD